MSNALEQIAEDSQENRMSSHYSNHEASKRQSVAVMSKKAEQIMRASAQKSASAIKATLIDGSGIKNVTKK